MILTSKCCCLSLILKKFQKKSCVSAGANFVGSAVPRLGWFGRDALRGLLIVLVVSDHCDDQSLILCQCCSRKRIDPCTQRWTCKMLGFMDYVQNAFYETSHWNRDNSYGSLTATARGNLPYIFSPSNPPPSHSADHPVTTQLSSTSTPRAASASTSPPSPRPTSQPPTPSAASAPSTAPSPTSTPPSPSPQSRAATTSNSATSSKAIDNCKNCAGRTQNGMIGSSRSTAKVPSSPLSA